MQKDSLKLCLGQGGMSKLRAAQGTDAASLHLPHRLHAADHRRCFSRTASGKTETWRDCTRRGHSNTFKLSEEENSSLKAE